MLKSQVLNGSGRIHHAFFTRQGGVSDGLFASLNCGFGSGDDAERVRENRSRAMRVFDLEADNLTTVHQVHSAAAVAVDEPWPLQARPRADGLVTDRPGIALGVLTADCAPVLLADEEAGVIGAAHAGWRGAKDGIVEATVEAMTGLGARPERIVAAVGPCIAQGSYEVGPEFEAAFAAADPANAGYFIAAGRPDHFMFDLSGYVADRVRGLGLEAVEVLDCDTCADDRRFFSYRRATQRGEDDYGRGLSAIALDG